MKFSDFIKEGKVRTGSSDKQLALSLIKTTELDLKFLRSLEITRISARKIMIGYYDALRSTLEAIAAIEGFKVYSHEALAYFLKEKGENYEKFDRFRKIRNSINYYGKTIHPKDVKQHKKDILSLIKELKKKLVQL